MIFTRDDGGDQTRATLVLTGEIDVATAPALRHVTENLPLQELQRLTVDLRDVAFMDSTGVGFLIAVRKEMLPGSELLVVNPQPMVARVLRMTGVDEIVGLVEDVPRPRPLPEDAAVDAAG